MDSRRLEDIRFAAQRPRSGWGRSLILGAALIIVIIIFMSSARHLYNKTAEETNNSLVAFCNSMSSLVNSRLEGDLKAIGALASHIGSHDEFNLQVALSSLRRQYKWIETNQGLGSKIGLALPDGTAYMTDGSSHYVGDTEYYTRAMSGETCVTPAMNGPALEHAYNAYASPVFFEGNIVAVLISYLPSAEFKKSLSDSVFIDGDSYVIDTSGRSVFMDETGGLVDDISKSVFEALSAYRFADGYSLEKLRSEMAAGGSGIFTFYDPSDGRLRYACFSPIELGDWYLLCFVPDDVVHERHHEYRSINNRLLLGLSVIVLIMFLALFLTQLNRSRDVAGLAKHLERLTNNIQGGIVEAVLDDELTMRYVSDGFVRLTGFSRKKIMELFDGKLANMLPKEDSQLLLSAIGAKDEDGGFVMDCSLFSSGGGDLAVNVRGLSPKGDGNLVYCTITDISEKQMILMSLEDKANELIYRDMELKLAMSGANFCRFDYIVTNGAALVECPVLDFSQGESLTITDIPEGLSEVGIVDELYSEACLNAFNEIRNGERQITYQIVAFSGKNMRWLKIMLTVIVYESRDNLRAVGIVHDITQEKGQEERLLRVAQSDQMTELYNKRTTEAAIAAKLGTLSDELVSALFVVDVDNFKSVNDRFGHMVGDNVLIGCAWALQELFNNGEVIGRIGGDEFMVFLPDYPSKEAIFNKAEEVCKSFRKVHTPDGHSVISASVGVAFWKNSGLSFEQLYKNADSALYETKKDGKNGYSMYQE